MRLLLVVLMIALLPLRGWAITAMAVDHGSTTKHIAASCPPLVDDSPSQPHPNGHASCDACGLCHLGCATATLITFTVPRTGVLPAAPGKTFASISLPPRLKPPIG